MKTVLIAAFYIQKHHADVWFVHNVYNDDEVNGISLNNVG